MNKRTQRWLSLVLSVMMVLAMAVPALATEPPAPPTTTDTVTLHKLLMSATELTNWNEDGPEGYDATQTLEELIALAQAENTLPAVHTITEIPDVYFAWQKWDPDATPAATWRYINAAGAFVDNVDDAMGGLTTATGITFTTTGFTGQYRIVEVPEKTTYIGEPLTDPDTGELIPNTGLPTLADSKAVPVVLILPLVNEGGIVKDAQVYPKNTEEAPEIQKGFEGWTDPNPEDEVRDYDVGDKVPYEVRTTVPPQARYQTFIWQDIMTEGLTFNRDLSFATNDPAVTLTADDYSIIYQNDGGFRVALTEAGLGKINNRETPLLITIKYTATLNGNAVVNGPEQNDIQLIYGNSPSESNTPIPVTPVNNQIILKKTWPTGDPGRPVTFDIYDGDGKRITTVTMDGTADDAPTVTDLSLINDLTGDPLYVTWQEAPGWTITITNLDQVPYTIIERVVPGYEPIYSADAATGTLTVKNKKTDHPTINPEEPEVVTGGKKFVKTGEAKARLVGAEFVVRNNNVGDPDFGKYLKRKTAATITSEQTAYDAAKAAYDQAIVDHNAWLAGAGATLTPEEQAAEFAANVTPKFNAMLAAFNAAQMEWEWITIADEADLPGEAMVFISDANGFFEVTGLAYGEYELIEIKAPEGYAVLTVPVDFTINALSYTTEDVDIPSDPDGTTNDAQEVPNKKVTIPQTGGIGTVIFAVVGLTLMGGAVIAFKRREVEE
ncbi:MAG: isopeptide-forming domain-containing fimbrial protein [Tissierellia bacterium]|nr:isopeptide-forming domain-containing fimbrial protein [Tissierellia bacterium]